MGVAILLLALWVTFLTFELWALKDRFKGHSHQFGPGPPLFPQHPDPAPDIHWTKYGAEQWLDGKFQCYLWVCPRCENGLDCPGGDPEIACHREVIDEVLRENP